MCSIAESNADVDIERIKQRRRSSIVACLKYKSDHVLSSQGQSCEFIEYHLVRLFVFYGKIIENISMLQTENILFLPMIKCRYIYIYIYKLLYTWKFYSFWELNEVTFILF